MRNLPSNGNTHERAYRFTSLSTSLFIQDLGFSKSDARPGSIVKNVEIERLDGTPTTLDEVMDGRTTLIVFGSISCPMTFGSVDVLRRLHADFGKKIKIVMLNVREAHPGENFEQPQSQQIKRDHAQLLATETNSPWETFIDTFDGELHRLLAEKPNAAFLLAPDRKVLFRSLWASDESGIREAVRSVVEGVPLRKLQSSVLIGPLAIGLGFFAPILARSGKRAKRELLLAAPPVAMFAALASMLRPLPVSRRGTVALALVASLTLLTALAITFLVTPRSLI